MNLTTNPAPEKDIHKDVEESNNSEDKESNNKILPDDATYDKSNQNANEVQDTSSDANKNPKDKKNQIISPEKDKDIQEYTHGSKMGSNNKSVVVQDTNRNPNKPEDNRNPVSKENE